jgi:hypothetical protein
MKSLGLSATDSSALFGGRQDPIFLEGLRGEEIVEELGRREWISPSMYYGGAKELLEAGNRRLARDTARAATTGG